MPRPCPKDPGGFGAAIVRDDPNRPINLIGDGLLPPDIDGRKTPKKDDPAPIVGTQDDGGCRVILRARLALLTLL